MSVIDAPLELHLGNCAASGRRLDDMLAWANGGLPGGAGPRLSLCGCEMAWSVELADMGGPTWGAWSVAPWVEEKREWGALIQGEFSGPRCPSCLLWPAGLWGLQLLLPGTVRHCTALHYLHRQPRACRGTYHVLTGHVHRRLPLDPHL